MGAGRKAARSINGYLKTPQENAPEKTSSVVSTN